MYREYLERVKKFININGNLCNIFGDYSKLYSMTTENIYGFLKNYDLQDKKILTVAGSGDQRLNAFLMGAKDITCFDINPLTFLQLNLKDTAISIINYEKFIKFFGMYSKKFGDYYHTLDSRIFDEFKHLLDNETYAFFNYIINELKLDEDDIYFDLENNLSILKNMNNYLNPDNYYKLSKIIKNKKIKFIDSDVVDLPNKLNGEKFDMILLSNISDYTHVIYGKNDLEKYRELIDKLINNLNLYGILQVGYIYSIYSKNDDVSDFNKKEKRQIYFPTDKFHSVIVNSYQGKKFHDKVITYQKLK
jgi:hypothetical protein